jgi:hypothetical protein
MGRFKSIVFNKEMHYLEQHAVQKQTIPRHKEKRKTKTENKKAFLDTEHIRVLELSSNYAFQGSCNSLDSIFQHHHCRVDSFEFSLSTKILFYKSPQYVALSFH